MNERERQIDARWQERWRAECDRADAAEAEIRRLRAAVDAALALHATHRCLKGCVNDGKRCQACWEEVPCRTRRALADPGPQRPDTDTKEMP